MATMSYIRLGVSCCCRRCSDHQMLRMFSQAWRTECLPALHGEGQPRTDWPLLDAGRQRHHSNARTGQRTVLDRGHGNWTFQILVKIYAPILS